MNNILPTQQRRFFIATLAGVSIIVLLALIGYWNIQEDDSYIFYSYAKNLANGNGYVFNIGERVNATTSPLYTLLLALIYLIFRFIPFVTIPLIGHLIGIASLFFICLFLMQSFRAERTFFFPFILPLVFLINPLLPEAVGMETFPVMMLALTCLYFYAKEKLLAASLACSLAVLARPDVFLLAAVLVSYHFIRYRRLPAISVALAFLLPIVVWIAFSLAYFGDLIPSTLWAKLAQTKAGLWGTGPVFFEGLWYFGFQRAGTVALSLLMAALILGLVLFVLKYRQWSVLRHPVFHLILLWNFVYLIVYGLILKAPAYFWYYTPLALGISLIITLPVEAFYHFVSNTNAGVNRIVLPAIYVVLVLAGLWVPFVLSQAPLSRQYKTYRQAAEWLNANAKEGSSVGAGDIGILRYFYENGPVIDAAGLVDPEIAKHVRSREFDWFIHQYQPDYLMFNDPPRPWGENKSMTEEDWFQKEYTLRTVVRTDRRAVGIYERQDP